jgi:hypothetical protein
VNDLQALLLKDGFLYCMKETGLTFEGCIVGGEGKLIMYAGRIVSNLAIRCVITPPLPRPVYPYGYPLRKFTGLLYQRTVFPPPI